MKTIKQLLKSSNLTNRQLRCLQCSYIRLIIAKLTEEEISELNFIETRLDRRKDIKWETNTFGTKVIRVLSHPDPNYGIQQVLYILQHHKFTNENILLGIFDCICQPLVSVIATIDIKELVKGIIGGDVEAMPLFCDWLEENSHNEMLNHMKKHDCHDKHCWVYESILQENKRIDFLKVINHLLKII